MTEPIHMHRTDIWTSWKLSQADLYALQRIVSDLHSSPARRGASSLSFIVSDKAEHDFDSFRSAEIERYYTSD